MSGIDFKGLDELDIKIDMILRAFPGKRAVFHKKAGDVILDRVKEHTPYDVNRKKGTHLRDAIYLKVGSKGGYAAVRPDYKKAPHAYLVEEGHIITKEDGTEEKIKGEHMFRDGAQEAEMIIMYMADNFVDEVVSELK